MKWIIPLLFFIVTWNEYALECVLYSEGDFRMLPVCTDRYKVVLATQTIHLERQIDVDRFVGECDQTDVPAVSGSPIPCGIISPNAFNIEVKEVKE